MRTTRMRDLTQLISLASENEAITVQQDVCSVYCSPWRSYVVGNNFVALIFGFSYTCQEQNSA